MVFQEYLLFFPYVTGEGRGDRVRDDWEESHILICLLAKQLNPLFKKIKNR